MKLLVPLDGSEPAFRALRHAAATLGGTTSPAIHLLSVYQDPPRRELGLHTAHEVLVAKLRSEREIVLSAGARILEEEGVPHTREIAEGPIARTIVERAEAAECDAIVMGTRGMTATGNLVLGSVATKVVHETPLPVTLVK